MTTGPGTREKIFDGCLIVRHQIVHVLEAPQKTHNSQQRAQLVNIQSVNVINDDEHSMPFLRYRIT